MGEQRRKCEKFIARMHEVDSPYSLERVENLGGKINQISLY